MPFAQVNDLLMYYEIHGEVGTPLILIMGLGASKLGWPPAFIERLATKQQVIIFDNRGAGQTDKPSGPYTMAQFAADTVGLLDALDIERAHVCGISMGGMIAQHVALDYPERVLGLVLGCTGMGGAHAVKASEEVMAVLLKPPSDDRAQDARASWPIIYTPAFVEANRNVLERRLEELLAYPEQPPYAFQLQLGAVMQTHDTFARLPAIQHPTLVQTGAEDILMPPENSKILAEQIPNARLIEYPGAAHAYFAEAGLRPVNDILAFLAEVENNSLFANDP